MKEFSIGSLSSKPVKNIFSVTSKVAPELSKSFCSLIFNENTEIKVPILVAASQSSSVTKCIEVDPTKRKFSFNVTMKNDNNNSILNSFKSLLENNIPIQLNEEEDFINLASIGLSIGNEELISPLSEKLKSESSSMSCDNVVGIINMKLTFGEDQMGGLELETSFIAKNFDKMSKREDFFNFAKDIKHSQIIEQIIRSDQLKIEEEDVLLSFVIKLCKSTLDFSFLFELVFLEYCTVDKCRELLTFVKEQYESSNAKSIIMCFGRRIIQPVALEQKYIKERHAGDIGTAVSMEDPRNGIFRREGTNAKVHASSNDNENFRKLFVCDDNYYDNTSNRPNQYITFSFKDDTVVKINGYMLRGNNQDGNYKKLKSWKLEGQKESNNEWVLLDRHNNEPFTKLELRTYRITCNEKFKAFRITQEDKNDGSNYCLSINAFDIFGTVIKKKK